MHEPVPNHLVLPLKPLPRLTPRTPLHRTIVRPLKGVHIGVRVEQVLRLERPRSAALKGTLVRPRLGRLRALGRGQVVRGAVGAVAPVVGCQSGKRGVTAGARVVVASHSRP